MENIKSIILPDFKAKKTRSKKEPTKILIEKESLSRTNRTLICKYCESDRILNPDQYQSLFDLHGSEEKVNEEFQCKPCEMNMKNNGGSSLRDAVDRIENRLTIVEDYVTKPR